MNIDNNNEMTSIDFILEAPKPNPFNASTILAYCVPEAGIISLIVYDILGREVACLYDGYQNSGGHKVVFNASALASGIYFCCLRAQEYTLTRKLCIIK